MRGESHNINYAFSELLLGRGKSVSGLRALTATGCLRKLTPTAGPQPREGQGESPGNGSETRPLPADVDEAAEAQVLGPRRRSVMGAKLTR